MARPVVHEPTHAPPRTTSSLYCRYHGFLIGQTLARALAFADGAGDDSGYAARRLPLVACLDELDVDIAIPESPARRDGVSHAALLGAIDDGGGPLLVLLGERLVSRDACNQKEVGILRLRGGGYE